MQIIAWTYEADYHCPDCARLRFGHALEDPDTVDDEGNPIHPVYEWDEAPVHGIICGDCGEEIVPPVDAWVDVWEGEDGYVTVQVFVGRDVFSSYEIARWEGDEVYRMIENGIFGFEDGFSKYPIEHGLDRESVLNYCKEHGLLKWHGQELV